MNDKFIFNNIENTHLTAISFIEQNLLHSTPSTTSEHSHPYLELSADDAKRLASRRKVISSGSIAIDALLQGGYRTGQLVEVFGESKTGKTQLALQATLFAASQGLGAVFVDTEGTFRPERLARMADLRGQNPEAILSRVFSIRAETTSKQTESIDMMRSDQRVSKCKMVIVDSVSKNFSVEYGGERRLQTRQSLLSVYLNKLARDAFLNDRAVLLTNRVAARLSPSARKESVALGGQTLRRFVGTVIHLTRKGGGIYATSLLSGDQEGKTFACSLTEKGFE